MKMTLAVAFWATLGLQAAEFHVSPDGHPGAMGSASAPWDIVTALKHPAAVLPGDTIWIHGGVYYSPSGNLFTAGYRSELKGAPNKPIYVRAYPGERAILDGRQAGNYPALTINGEWTWYWGLEFTNSDPNRRATTNASNGAGTRGHGMVVFGANVKVINCVVHDTGTAIGFWQSAIDAELYGNIVYNNGWISPQRSHGHGTYTQNLDGVKRIRDSVYFNQFAGGIEVYGTNATYLRNYLIKGNTVFNDGFISSGGNAGVWNLLFSENMLFAATCSFMDHINVGKSLRVENNYFGQIEVGLAKVDRAEFTGNTFVRKPGNTLVVNMALAPDVPLAGHLFDKNVYQLTPKESRVLKVSDNAAKTSRTLTFAQMQQEGFESHGSSFISADVPPEVKVFVRPNEYEPGRANVTVYNWPKQKHVSVDLSSLGILKGDRYEIRNAQNYFVEKLTGIYNGTPILIPMTGWSIARPIGLEEPIAPTTFPTFGVFVLTWKKVTPAPAVNSAASKWLSVAPGSLAEANGENLARAAVSAGAQPAAELDGTRVEIVDYAGKTHTAPLFSISPERISFQVPETVAEGYAAMSVVREGKTLAAASLSASAVAPGIFTASGDGTGPALCSFTIVSPDSTVETVPCSRCDAGLCAAIPIALADRDVTLSLYGTGIRNADPGSIFVSIGGETLTPSAMVPLTDTPGLDLVNVHLPSSLAGKGEVPVILTAGGTGANPVSINLQ